MPVVSGTVYFFNYILLFSIDTRFRIDQFYIDRQSSSNGFMPPGRPRNWHQKCLDIIASTVKQRIEGNQLEDRSLNRQWLAR